MTTLSELLVSLGLDSAKFRQGLNNATNDLKTFKDTTRDIKKTLDASLAFEVAKFAADKISGLIVRGAELADGMGKLAQKTGIPVKELSALSFAAELGDVSSEQLATSLNKLSKEMAEAAGKSKGTQTAFSALGVSVTDSSGKLRSTKDVLLDVSEKFSKIEDGAGKAALAQQIFGKSGSELIPFLNEGKEGIQKLADEAERLGLVIDEQTAAAADNFNDNLTRLQKGTDGLAIQLAANLGPTLQSITDELVGTSKEAGALKTIFTDLLTATVKLAATLARGLAGAFAVVGKSVAGTGATLAELVRGNFAGAREIQEQAGKDILESIQATGDSISRIWEDATNKVEEKSDEQSRKLAAPILKAPQKIKDEGKKAAETIREVIDGIKKDIAVLNAKLAGESGASAEIDFRLKNDLSDELAKMGQAAAGAANELRAVTAEQERLSEQLKAKQEGEEAFQRLTDIAADLRAELAGNNDEFADLAAKAADAGKDTDELTESIRSLNAQLKKKKDLEKFAADVVESQKTPTDLFREKLTTLKDAVDAGALTQAQYTQAVEDTTRAYEEAGGKFQDIEQKLTSFQRAAAEGLQSAIADNLGTVARGFGELAASLTKNIATGQNLFDNFKKGFETIGKGILAMGEQFSKTLARMVQEAIAAEIVRKLVGAVFGGGGGIAGAASGLTSAVVPGAPGPAPSPLTAASSQGLRAGDTFAQSTQGLTAPTPGPVNSESSNVIPFQRTETRHIHTFDQSSLQMTLREWLEGELANEAANHS